MTSPENRIFDTPPSLQTYSGPWDEVAVRHFLRRTMFGTTKTAIQFFHGVGLQGAINQLLDDRLSMPDPPVKEYATGSAAVPDTNIALGQTWVNDPNTDGTISSLRRASFKKWWVGTMLRQEFTIREKMTLFWHNHFATEANDIGNAQYIFKHHQLLRSQAMGNIKSLVRAVTIDPAMLVYLNGQNNNKTAPDENYAREIQELFVIGKGPAAAFTESDVKSAARVLTGWRNNATKMESYFDSSRHDIGNKAFSSFYGNRIIAGRTGSAAGETELNELIEMLFATEEAALFLSRKIYRWFVYYLITPEVEEGVIRPLAQIMRQHDYEIKPVLQALLSSEHFFDPMNRGCQIKSPVDMLVGMVRQFGVAFPPADQYISNYGLWNQLVNYLTNMQQNLGDPPDVSGWKAYYQEPGFYKYWINSDTLPRRIQYLDNLTAIGYTFNGFKMVVDSAAYARTFQNPGDPNVLVEEASIELLGIPLSVQHKQQIKKDILLSGQNNDYYWTNAWETYINQPSNAMNTKYVINALTNLFKYMVDLPEYQLA